MPIILKAGPPRPPANSEKLPGYYAPPDEGVHLAVIVDVIDKPQVSTQYGEKHMIELRWEIEQENRHGVRFTPRLSFNYTLGGFKGRPSNLLRFLTILFGQIPDEKLRAGIDVEKLIGHVMLIQIGHNVVTKDNGSTRTWGNVVGYMKAPKGSVLTVRDYKREAP